MIEGKSRAIGLPKVWRLTKKGRDKMGAKNRQVSFTSGKIEHWISVANDFITLAQIGEVFEWEIEPRYPFKVGGKTLIYSPDAFFKLKANGKKYAYFLEHQDSPLTSKRWAEKWAMISQFKDSPEYRKTPFQTKLDKNMLVHPRIMVISSQLPETVQGGSILKLFLAKDVKSLQL